MKERANTAQRAEANEDARGRYLDVICWVDVGTPVAHAEVPAWIARSLLSEWNVTFGCTLVAGSGVVSE